MDKPDAINTELSETPTTDSQQSSQPHCEASAPNSVNDVIQDQTQRSESSPSLPSRELTEPHNMPATVDGLPEEMIMQVPVDIPEEDDNNEDEDGDDVDDDDNGSFADDDDSGDETDVEDNLEQVPFPGTYVLRLPNPDLPDTVTTLHTDEGGKVYLVGTAHFSRESQEDVAKTIQLTQPDVVMVELCSNRVGILQLDEEKLLQEAKNINFEKFRMLVKQAGVVQGVVHILLLSMSAHLTKQLGMAPGGEFRRAFQEAQKIPGCRIHLGDRPVGVTLRRAIHSLSWWQKLQLVWALLTSKDPISKEEVEKCKQRDLLEEMMREMAGEFPALSQVFVKERDLFLANSLRFAAKPVPDPNSPSGTQPPVVVGVVGIGHVQGIVDNWETEVHIQELMRVPMGSVTGKVIRWTFRATLVVLLSWGCLKLYKKLPLPQLQLLS